MTTAAERLMRRHPEIPWTKPARVRLGDYRGLACQFCFSFERLRGADVPGGLRGPGLFETEAEWRAHMEAEHPELALGEQTRTPYVGEGADGARRSAQIDREEAHRLVGDDPRRVELFASARRWDRQADAAEPRAFRLEQTDADEYVLVLNTEGVLDPLRIVMGAAEAMELFEAVDAGIGDHVREGRRERAAYDAASPEERARVLGREADGV